MKPTIIQPPIDQYQDEEDRYGSFPDGPLSADFDYDQLASAVVGLLMEHPIPNLAHDGWGGSAVGAKLSDAVSGSHGEVHPKSLSAMAMAAVVDGVCGAVLERLLLAGVLTEKQFDAAHDVMSVRSRNWTCPDCRIEVRIRSAIGHWCKAYVADSGTL